MERFQLFIKYRLIYAIFFFGVISFTGCNDSVGLDNLNLFSTSDDIKLGKQLDEQIKSNPKEYPIYNNTQATSYIQSMVNEILQSPLIEYKDKFAYKVTLINSKTINAFAAPGGYIYVYTGILKYVDNEATIAAILAHEIAHAERRHATKRMTKQYGVSFLLDLILGDNPSQWASLGANMLTGVGFLKNSRDDEYEADEYSVKYLLSTKWYPGASTYFFTKIGASQNSGGTDIAELLSTHPMDQKRIDAVNALLVANKVGTANENNLFATRYLQFRNTLP